MVTILELPGGKADPEKSFSGKEDWQTPEWLVKWIDAYRRIDFDPCTNSENPTRAVRYHTREEDALHAVWHLTPGDFVFMNPPYSRAVGQWTERFLDELPTGAEGLALVRLDNTRWFNALMDEATAMCLPRKRIKFFDPSIGEEVGGTNFASALIQIGGNPRHFSHHWENVARLGPCLRR